MGTFIVENMMKKDVVTASEDDSVYEAIELMRRKKTGSVVISRNKRVLGIVTKGDVIERAIKGEKDLKTMKLCEIMTSPVVTASSSDEISDVLLKMNEKDITHIIVMEGERIGGIISITDIINPHVLLDILRTLPSLIALAHLAPNK